MTWTDEPEVCAHCGGIPHHPDEQCSVGVDAARRGWPESADWSSSYVAPDPAAQPEVIEVEGNDLHNLLALLGQLNERTAQTRSLSFSIRDGALVVKVNDSMWSRGYGKRKRDNTCGT